MVVRLEAKVERLQAVHASAANTALLADIGRAGNGTACRTAISNMPC